jgi:hypothetical protein
MWPMYGTYIAILLGLDQNQGITHSSSNQVPCHGGEVMCSRATCRRHDPFH